MDTATIEDRLTALEKRQVAVEEILHKLHSSVQLIIANSGAVDSMSVSDAAEITGYKVWTLRNACLMRRIPESFKRIDGMWMIPSAVVIRIKEHGLPASRPVAVAVSASS